MSKESVSYLGCSSIRNNGWKTVKCDGCSYITGTKELGCPLKRTRKVKLMEDSNDNDNDIINTDNTNNNNEQNDPDPLKNLCGYCIQTRKPLDWVGWHCINCRSYKDSSHYKSEGSELYKLVCNPCSTTRPMKGCDECNVSKNLYEFPNTEKFQSRAFTATTCMSCVELKTITTQELKKRVTDFRAEQATRDAVEKIRRCYMCCCALADDNKFKSCPECRENERKRMAKGAPRMLAEKKYKHWVKSPVKRASKVLPLKLKDDNNNNNNNSISESSSSESDNQRSHDRGNWTLMEPKKSQKRKLNSDELKPIKSCIHCKREAKLDQWYQCNTCLLTVKSANEIIENQRELGISSKRRSTRKKIYYTTESESSEEEQHKTKKMKPRLLPRGIDFAGISSMRNCIDCGRRRHLDDYKRCERCDELNRELSSLY